MLTPKENLLRAIRHHEPERVPTAMEGIAWIGPPVFERPFAAGCDDFGVHWSYEARAEGGTFPTSGGHTITDLARMGMAFMVATTTIQAPAKPSASTVQATAKPALV